MWEKCHPLTKRSLFGKYADKWQPIDVHNYASVHKYTFLVERIKDSYSQFDVMGEINIISQKHVGHYKN